MTLVSVLTPTIPQRAAFLAECELSVAAQTYRSYEHRTLMDGQFRGCAVTMNKLAADAIGEWLLPLADDDLLLPGALATLLAGVSVTAAGGQHSPNRASASVTRDGEGADALAAPDIVYSPPLVTGNEDRWWFFQAPPAIPSCALIRAELWRDLGGYDESLAHEEDRDLWVRALNAGARFVRVDEPTWVYRQWQGNKSFNKAAA